MSTFQILPRTIVYQILPYFPYTISYRWKNKPVYFSLLQVSSIWRKNAQEIAFGHIELKARGNQCFDLDSMDLYRMVKNSDYHYLSDIVKHVDLELFEQDILEGHFLADFPDEVCSNLEFKNASTLTLSICREEEDYTDYEEFGSGFVDRTSDTYKRAKTPSLQSLFKNNIQNFVAWVTRIAPNFKKMNINMGQMCYRYRGGFEIFATQIFQMFECSIYSSLSVQYPIYKWNINHPLSELNLYWLNDYNNCSELIKQNASTLKSLNLVLRGDKGFRNVWDIFGYKESITYPCLQKLHLNNWIDEWAEQGTLEKINPSYTPFPGLEYLKTSYKYTIEDDVLFRGNENSLVKLNISVRKEWLHVLKDILIKRNSNCIKYFRLKLKPLNHHVSNLSNEPVYNDFIQTLPLSLQKLCFKSNPLPGCIIHANQYARFTHLQTLMFEKTVLELEQVCQLLEAIPGLRELHAYNFMLGSHLKDKTEAEITNLISSKYNLDNSNISFIYAILLKGDIGFSSLPETDIAVCSSVLSALCSKFSQIHVGKRYQEAVYDGKDYKMFAIEE